MSTTTTARTRDYYRGYAMALTTSKALRTSAGLTVWHWETDQRETIVGTDGELIELLAGLRDGGVVVVVDLVRAAAVDHAHCRFAAADLALETVADWLA